MRTRDHPARRGPGAYESSRYWIFRMSDAASRNSAPSWSSFSGARPSRNRSVVSSDLQRRALPRRCRHATPRALPRRCRHATPRRGRSRGSVLRTFVTHLRRTLPRKRGGPPTPTTITAGRPGPAAARRRDGTGPGRLAPQARPRDRGPSRDDHGCGCPVSNTPATLSVGAVRLGPESGLRAAGSCAGAGPEWMLHDHGTWPVNIADQVP
jgi:hypothetical protein